MTCCFDISCHIPLPASWHELLLFPARILFISASQSRVDDSPELLNAWGGFGFLVWVFYTTQPTIKIEKKAIPLCILLIFLALEIR